MKQDTSSKLRITGVLVLLASLALAGLWAVTRPIVLPDGLSPWQIVKQRTNDYFQLNNYGFVTDSGSVIAGFTNIQDAIRERDLCRNPPITISKKPNSIWEIVK